MLGEPILEIINSLNCPKPASILLRHSERPKIYSAKDNNDVSLTKNCKKEAKFFGRELKDKYSLMHLMYSPVLRCKETALCIREGFESNKNKIVKIEDTSFLGGSYLRDTDKALDKADELGSDFVRAWFDGEFSENILKPLNESAEEHLKNLKNDLKSLDSKDTVLIYVTHDWNTIVIREGLFSLKHEDIGFPNFMDGFVFTEEDGCFLAYYKTKEEIIKKDVEV